MVIRQAMGMPKGRGASRHVELRAAFVEEMKASGFVAEALEAPQHRGRGGRSRVG